MPGFFSFRCETWPRLVDRILIWCIIAALICILLILLILAMDGHAYAQGAPPAPIVAPVGSTAVIPQPDGSILFQTPFWNEYVLPTLDQLWAWAIGALITWVGFKVNAFLKSKGLREISAANLDLFRKAASTQAGAIIAAHAGDWVNAAIGPDHPEVVASATKVMARLDEEAKTIGMTPAKFQDMVAGEIGNRQVQAIAAPTAAAPDTPK